MLYTSSCESGSCVFGVHVAGADALAVDAHHDWRCCVWGGSWGVSHKDSMGYYGARELISVTFEVSQSPIGWLKASVPLNINRIDVTFDVSHAPIG